VVDSIRVRRGTHDNMRWPGFGVGGYCLTKDSLLAQWSATHLHESDLVLRMTLDALRVNYEMPRHTFHLLTELLGGHLRGKTIAVLGISYLPEVGDTRNSPTELLCDELAAAGATPRVHDPHVAVWNERPEITVWRELPQCLEGVDGIVLAVGHREYLELDVGDIVREGAHPPVIVDAQNLVDDDKAARLHHAGCRILGVGKGHWRKRNYETTPTP